MRLFDTHSHYNDEKFNDDREEIIKLIYEAGVTNTVVVGDNIENSKKAIEIAKKYDFIYSAVRSSSN
ncbi:MAG: TatD family hydrolase [Clostridia bacterium]|nr:TatD family hydrolase [Clostridia bacterium]